MADKSFGVKDINLIGTSGTPEIESPNNLNINAINVAISTDMSVGSDLTVTGHTETATLKSSGISTFVGHVALSTSLNVAGIVTAGDGLRIPGGTFLNTRLELGNSQEFSFQYNTSSTKGIVRVSSQDLDIEAKNIGLYPNNGENGVLAKQNGAVELYYDNSKKFETSGAGVTVTGTVISDQLSVSGITSLGTDGGSRFIEIDNDAITFKSSDNNASILGTGLGGLSINPGGSEDSVTIGTYAIFKSNGNVTLNNGGNGSTQLLGPLDMREDFYNTVGVTSVAQLRTTSLQVSGISTLTGHVALSTSLTVAGISTFDINTGQSVEFRDTSNNGHVAINMASSYEPQIQFISHDNDIASISGDSNANMIIAAGATLNLRANTSDVVLQAAGNNTDIYGHNAKKLTLTSSGIEVAGIVTAISGVSTFYGDVSKAAAGRWYLGAGAGNTSYFFTGIGFTNVDYAHNPVMHLARGQRYEFVNEMGAHPFQIQSGSVGGDPYDPGVTNNNASSGTIAIEVPFNAPNQLFYQCTSHSGMGGTFTIYPSI